VHLLTASGTSLPVAADSSGYLDVLAEARVHTDDELGQHGLVGITERARQMQAGDTLICLTGRAAPEGPGRDDGAPRHVRLHHESACSGRSRARWATRDSR